MRSEILSPEFFLAPDGAMHSEAEPEATLRALFAPAPEKPDEHAQCRFVARYQWLRKVLDWGGAAPPRVACEQYLAFSSGDQVQSLSLVYATGYFSNPASFYGHILLKFNARRTVVFSEMLDQSVNYGAMVPPRENPFAYILKGMFGGYDATFSHQQFYSFNHAYGENDLRDMWDYELALAPDEVQQVVAHTWELLGKRHHYYFFSDNCAFRMARLLELVVGQPLLPPVPYSLPGAIFERIAVVQRNGEPLLRSVRRIPSRQSRFRDRYAALEPRQQAAAVALVEADLDTRTPRYAALSQAEQTPVVDMLLDYYEYRSVIDRSDVAMRAAKQKLLLERARLPMREGLEDPVRSDAAPPHHGPLPIMARVGPVANSRFGGGTRLTLRPANYDALALDAGRIPDSVLIMLDAELVHSDERTRLRRLGFVRVENPNVAVVPLPKDGGWSWGFAMGLEEQDLGCRSCTVLRVTAGGGRSIGLARGLTASAMLDGAFETPNRSAGNFSVTPRFGLMASPWRGWKSELSIGRRVYVDDQEPRRRVARWENRFGSSRHWDVRVGYEENAAREVFAGVSLYW